MTAALRPHTAIAAIGYPANDPHEDPNLVQSYFGSTFDVKRLSPGEIIEHNLRSDSHPGYFTHDCSTLGGNSGSAVIHLATGAAVGLHYAGRSLKANFAVDSATIKKLVGPLLRLENVNWPVRTPPVHMLWPEEEERKGGGRDFENPPRRGYNEGFLGSEFKLAKPKVSSHNAVETLNYCHFSIQVHKARKQPWWTAVNINGSKLPSRNPKRASWIKDPRISEEFQIDSKFYTNSCFSRGHLVRRLDPVWGTEFEVANADTFTYANVCPQDQDFNANFWGDLEDEVLHDAHGQLMTVFTGPIFQKTDPTYTNNGISVMVPYNFFKIPAFVRNGKIVASAYVLSQQSYLEGRDPASWRTYQVSIAEVEKQTSIDFGVLREYDTFNVLESAHPTGRRLIQSLDDLHPHLFVESALGVPRRVAASASAADDEESTDEGDNDTATAADVDEECVDDEYGC